jgi:hypothetical protein
MLKKNKTEKSLAPNWNVGVLFHVCVDVRWWGFETAKAWPE